MGLIGLYRFVSFFSFEIFYNSLYRSDLLQGKTELIMVGYTSRRNCRYLFLFILIIPFLILSQSKAQTRYVSDYLTINIKDNIEKPYTVVAKVKSNDPLVIIEENETYAKVETAEKKVGWIAKQYLTASLPKNLVIEQLKKEIADLRANGSSASPTTESDCAESKDVLAERDRLQLELQTAMTRIAELQVGKGEPERLSPPLDNATIPSEIKRLGEQKLQLESEIHSLQLQYESISDGTLDVAALIKDKENLLAELTEKKQKIATLSAENENLAKRATIYWFCAGALVFVFGMVSGKMLNRKKTKYSY